MFDENPKPIRLLLADDEEDLVTFLALRLRKRGIEVTMAVSGAEAISAANQLIFDVAVVDLRMPDMDGIKIIDELKSVQPHLEVLMLTGHGGPDSAWEAGRLHAYRYLLKPHDFEDLYNLICEAAAHRRDQLRKAFDHEFNALLADTSSARDIIEESDRLRREYEQD